MIYFSPEYKIRVIRYSVFLMGDILLKRQIISAVLICTFALAAFANYYSFSKNKNVPSADIQSGVAVLEQLDAKSVDEAQASVDEIEKKRLEAEFVKNKQKHIKQIIKQINKGDKSLRQVFKNVWFVGDSLMNGLEAYNILNPNRIISQVSASLFHLEENYDKIVQARPPVLILHYGINMIGAEDAHLKNYIQKYTSIIENLKKDLPETRIIVSLIFPVDRSVATAKRFSVVSKWNKALIKMCKNEKVEYLDSSPIFKEHKEWYAKDGIHQAKGFYVYWLKFIMLEKEIY